MLHTSLKGIANLHIFNAEQNLFSKKNRRADTHRFKLKNTIYLA